MTKKLIFTLFSSSLFILLSVSLLFSVKTNVYAQVRTFRSGLPDSSNYIPRGPIEITAMPIRPKPTSFPPITIPPRKNGTVAVNAWTITCGSKRPYQGTFRVCPNITILDSQDSPQTQIFPPKEYCFNLPTDKSGYGKISIPPGSYNVRPPLWCPPGAYCVATNDNNQSPGNSTLIADPYSWKIDPQSFNLSARSVVYVKALGVNRLVMCPIRIEE